MADDEKNPPCAIGGCREEQQQQQTEKKKKTRDEKVPGGGSEAGDAIRAGPDLVGDDGFNAGADQELGRAAAAAGGVVGEKTSSSLPFSKARCIALVATVTGAAFLNVSQDMNHPFLPPPLPTSLFLQPHHHHHHRHQSNLD